nr:hypothetical protein Iba_scaffold58695CG0010 [Ipomoea batatas]
MMIFVDLLESNLKLFFGLAFLHSSLPTEKTRSAA